MTDENTNITETADPKDALEPLTGEEGELLDASRIDRLKSAITGGATDGTLAMASGGTMVAMGARSIAQRRVRGVFQALVGVGLLKFGLGQRRSAEEPWEPSTDVFGTEEESESEGESEDEYDGEAAEGSDDKETSDDAYAAVERHDMTSQSGDDPGDLAEGFETDEPGSSDVSFVEDKDPVEESKPGLESDVEDPRRSTDEDEGVDIDVSEDATAEDPGEATGPDPEQAQPAQTDATEPERSPEEDESRFDETPSTDGGPSAGDDDSDGEQLGQDETDAEGDSEAMGDDEGSEDEGGDATDDDASADYEVDEDDDEEGMNGP